MSGDRIVVGAFNETSAATGINGNGGNQSFSQAGAAYVFFRNGSAWTQEAYLKASNTSVGAAFGFSVAISGATVLVGAVGEASSATGVDGDQSQSGALGAGAAYVFRRSGSTWMQEAYLKASNTQTKAFFGTSGAIDGDTLVVGADGESSSASGIDGDQSSTTASIAGAAYLFHRSAGKWTQLAYVKAPNPRPIASFGASVALSGEALVVGSPFESSAATGVNGNQGEASTFRGAAYLY